jgi:FlaA1/EpsC-like NDP-sugar epimerase
MERKEKEKPIQSAKLDRHVPSILIVNNSLLTAPTVAPIKIFSFLLYSYFVFFSCFCFFLYSLSYRCVQYSYCYILYRIIIKFLVLLYFVVLLQRYFLCAYRLICWLFYTFSLFIFSFVFVFLFNLSVLYKDDPAASAISLGRGSASRQQIRDANLVRQQTTYPPSSLLFVRMSKYKP